MLKPILTPQIFEGGTKSTKGSDMYFLKLRELRVFLVEFPYLSFVLVVVKSLFSVFSVPPW